MILMSLLYTVPIINIAIPVPLHLFFDIAVGALQAVIFTMLSLTFVGLAAEE
jgi:F-type H+-transporting ATPase subunit a